MPISNPFEKARCAAIMLFMLPRYGRSAIIYPRSLQNRFQVTTIAARVLNEFLFRRVASSQIKEVPREVHATNATGVNNRQ